MKSLHRLYALLAFAFLIGCGDNQINEITEINRLTLDVVAKKKDLPDCDSDIENKVVWVTAEERSYACSDGEWQTYVESDLPKDHSVECFTKELKDGSGVKVVCDGDSIGVLLYGENAGEITPPNTICSLRMLTSDSLKLECGKKSKLLSIDDFLDSLGESYEVVMDSEQVAVRLENIGGYSQKGPFLTGSEVIAYEIENGRTMKQTGTKFEGRISNDDGSFNIRSVKLASQYGFVSVNGFYLNEVSGGVSNVRVTMNAVTDFRNRNKVNVNVLTHMEYERILYLVTKNKYRFAEAKKKAEREIWKIFRIDDEKIVDDAEDLNVVGSGEGDAALLAMSILLQRNGDGNDLLSLITSIGNSIAEKGEWKNDSLDAAMAGWALLADVSGQYEVIEENVRNWGLSAKVPDFKPYLRHFWQSVIGVPACSDDNNDSVVFVPNKYFVNISTEDPDIVLKCLASENHWVALNDEEKDVFDWRDSLDGALKPGNLRNNVIYVFDSTGALDGKKGWRRTVGEVERAYGGCRKEVYGDTVFVKSNGKHFTCDEKSHLWTGTPQFSVIDPSLWPKNSDGDVRWDEKDSTCYVFEERFGQWRPGQEKDCNLGLMGCTLNRIGEITYSASENRYVRCVPFFEDLVAWKFAGPDEDCVSFCDSLYDKRAAIDGCERSSTEAYFFIDYYENEDDFMEAFGLTSTSEGFFKIVDYCKASVTIPIWNGVSDLVADKYGIDCNGRETFSGLLNPDTTYACKDGKMVVVNDMEKILGQLCYESVIGTLAGNGRYVCKDTTPASWGKSIGWTLATFFDTPREKADFFNHDLDYGELVDPRDGKTYKTIYIEGAGTWMAENLNFRDEKNYFYLRNGMSCVGGDEDCSLVGTVYSWSAAMNVDSKWEYETASKMDGIIKTPHQGICPDGWHIPTADEWLRLARVYKPSIETLENRSNNGVASSLLAKKTNEWPSATNESGMTILPMKVTKSERCSISGCSVFLSGKSSFISATSAVINVSEDQVSYMSNANEFIHYKVEMGSGAVRCKKDDAVEEGD